MTGKLDDLPRTYEAIKPSIVAIASKLSPQPHYAPIIGTGFIVGSDGIIITCNHVIKAMAKLPRKKGAPKEEWPAVVFYYHNIPDKGMLTIGMEIQGVLQIGKYEHKGIYYGAEIPDMGIILVNYSGLPSMELDDSPTIREGETVAVSGFPMGEDVFMAPGWVHQISPTLQSGIISAVLPFPCQAPHAYLIDVMAKGGSSGSPVFDPKTGKVYGMLYAVLQEPKKLDYMQDTIQYTNPTTLSFVLPSRYLSRALQATEKNRDTLGKSRGTLINMSDKISETLRTQGYNFIPPKEPQLNVKVDIETP